MKKTKQYNIEGSILIMKIASDKQIDRYSEKVGIRFKKWANSVFLWTKNKKI